MPGSSDKASIVLIFEVAIVSVVGEEGRKENVAFVLGYDFDAVVYPLVSLPNYTR